MARHTTCITKNLEEVADLEMAADVERGRVMKPETSTQEFASPYALVVFFSDEHRAALLKAIAQAGIVPLLCKSPEEAAEAMKNETVQVVVCEDLLPKEAVNAILKQAHNRTKPIPVVITSRTGEWEEYLNALRQGAFEYLVLPPRHDEVRRVLKMAVAEGSHTNAEQTGYGGASAFERSSLFSSLHRPWAIRLGKPIPILPGPLFHRTQISETEGPTNGTCENTHDF